MPRVSSKGGSKRDTNENVAWRKKNKTKVGTAAQMACAHGLKGLSKENESPLHRTALPFRNLPWNGAYFAAPEGEKLDLRVAGSTLYDHCMQAAARKTGRRRIFERGSPTVGINLSRNIQSAHYATLLGIPRKMTSAGGTFYVRGGVDVFAGRLIDKVGPGIHRAT